MYQALIMEDATRLDTIIAELAALEESQAQGRAARIAGLGDIRTMVLSHGIPQHVPGMPDDVNAAYEEAWQQMQTELAALSGKGRRGVVEDAGHMIHHERPDVVVSAIRDVVSVARG